MNGTKRMLNLKRHLLLSVLISLSINCYADTFSSNNFNMNFESIDKTKQLTYWKVTGDHFVEVVDTETKIKGKQALHLSTVNAKKQSPQSFFGQTIYADFEREFITLEAYVKYQNYSASGHFYLYLTTYEGDEEKFSDAEIKYSEYKFRNTNDWQKITLTLPISKSVLYAHIGGVLLGKGKIWVDELSLNFLTPYQENTQLVNTSKFPSITLTNSKSTQLSTTPK